MARKTWVYIDGVAYEKGTQPGRVVSDAAAPFVAGDEGSFISPVDGKVYSGRAGMREHNARNDVINNRDLVGLPTLQSNSDFRTSAEKRASAEHRKQMIINQVNKHYR